MSMRIGDTFFDHLGRPGLVTGRDDRNRLQVETKGENYDKARGRGFINGLEAEQRQQFNEVMDQIFALKDPREKVGKLSEKIDELKNDPRNFVVTRYLESELTHLMNTEGIQPKVYLVDEYFVRE